MRDIVERALNKARYESTTATGRVEAPDGRMLVTLTARCRHITGDAYNYELHTVVELLDDSGEIVNVVSQRQEFDHYDELDEEFADLVGEYDLEVAGDE